MSELRECPFCGGEAKSIRASSFAVACKECGADAGWYSAEADAADAWNRRAPVPNAAGQWTPVEDGEFNLDGNGISIKDNGKMLIIFDDIIGDAVAELPPDYRLCRLTGDEAQVPQEGMA
jgi:Lar family restriction alleviation protein